MLLRGDTATAKRSLHELLQIIWLSDLYLLVRALGEVVDREILSRRLRLLLDLEEFSGVLIAVIQSDLLSKD